MTHPTSIPAALSKEEWAHWQLVPDETRLAIDSACDHVAYSLHQNPCALVALANAALPGTDARKLTWAHVDALRDVVNGTHFNATWEDNAATCLRLAALIASYLPPR